MNKQFHTWNFFLPLCCALEVSLNGNPACHNFLSFNSGLKDEQKQNKTHKPESKNVLPAIHSIVYVAVFMHGYYLLVLGDK